MGLMCCTGATLSPSPETDAFLTSKQTKGCKLTRVEARDWCNAHNADALSIVGRDFVRCSLQSVAHLAHGAEAHLHVLR